MDDELNKILSKLEADDLADDLADDINSDLPDDDNNKIKETASNEQEISESNILEEIDEFSEKNLSNLSNNNKQESKENNTNNIEAKEGDLEKKETDKENKEKAEEAKEEVYDKFEIKGTKSWNTKEPYLIKIDLKKLEKDISNLKESFYFLDNTYNKNTIEKNLKKALARYIRSSNNIIQNYEEFIFKLIISEINTIIEYFKIDEKYKNLFLYHLGPQSIYSIIINILKKGKFGFCYKSKSKKVVGTLYPDEFIKERILIWFEENINHLELPFDSLQQLENIKDIISKTYLQERQKFYSKLNKINSQLPLEKNISAEKLLKIKWEDWYGVQKIVVFKRFNLRTIFGSIMIK